MYINCFSRTKLSKVIYIFNSIWSIRRCSQTREKHFDLVSNNVTCDGNEWIFQEQKSVNFTLNRKVDSSAKLSC